MRISSLLSLLLLLSSCATTDTKYITSENMLPDGVTWKVRVSEFKCETDQPLFGLSEKDREQLFEPCRKDILEAATQHGNELCGKAPHRLFNCGHSVRVEGLPIKGFKITGQNRLTPKVHTQGVGVPRHNQHVIFRVKAKGSRSPKPKGEQHYNMS